MSSKIEPVWVRQPIKSIQASVTFDVEAKGDGPPRLPRFSMVANTGKPMVLAGWKFPLVVDFAGLNIPSQSRPIRFDHDSREGVGHTDRIAVEGGNLVAEGVISRDTPAARDVVASGKNGFPWQASIGASVDEPPEFIKTGESVVVNAMTFTGPLNVARKTTLGEISFVDLGADDSTSAEIAAKFPPLPTPSADTKGPTMFDSWLSAKGFDPSAISDDQRTFLKAAFDAEQARPTPVAPPPGGSGSTKSLDALFAEERIEAERVAHLTRITAREVGRVRLSHPHLIESLEHEARTAIEARTDPKTYELELIRKLRELEGPGGSFNIHSRDGGQRANSRSVEAAVCRSAGLRDVEKQYDASTLEAADRTFRSGIGLQEMILHSARENGYTGHSIRSDLEGALRCAFPARRHDQIRAQGWSTYTLATLLGNVANKFLSQGFNAVEQTWRTISSQRPVNDFKAITTAALTGGFTFEKVGGGGELKHATVSELTYTNQAETYGKMFAITRKDIINDDLGVFDQVRTKLGRGGALGLNRDFWTVFLNNSAFFTAGRNNLATGAGTVLSLTSLAQAQALFRNQTDPDGDPVAIEPAILLVPNALEVTGFNMVNQTQIAGDTTANTLTFMNNPFAGKYTIAQSTYLSSSALTGNSTTAWYLLANPNDMATIEVVFLNGKDVPTVEQADADFNVLGIQFRAFLDYGINTKEYRGGVKMAGA